ncbi:uncharacterized protein LY79DRAFT_578619 [Colletotrichum navitas]|uniref:Transmembrane protein n=1 Tax=Colletotrichum navitas TaxID=681940 RepID=A0AAD8V6H1_9PEZI|nr:uncharacterized protein LY79DRAFT_578619 [Colletotrichum navitas]KAK1594318.1 hypothetical protein LY79DRAFT_578619 [Colletotrichum navitas]
MHARMQCRDSPPDAPVSMDGEVTSPQASPPPPSLKTRTMTAHLALSVILISPLACIAVVGHFVGRSEPSTSAGLPVNTANNTPLARESSGRAGQIFWSAHRPHQVQRAQAHAIRAKARRIM